MIILLGPDHSGKTTLWSELLAEGLNVWHAVRETDYDDYMVRLSGEKSRPIPLGQNPFIAGELLQKDTHYALDRWFYCEPVYSSVVRGETALKWSLKQFHNLHWATIAHNPVVVLMTRKGPNYDDVSVPEKFFNPILEGYRSWLKMLGVEYIEWDYANPPMTVEALIEHSRIRQENVVWWRNLAKRGIAGYGNTVNPRVLLLAEILGGYNVYHFPFEQGPSGYYLSELVDEASLPLSEFYITNWKKTLDPVENEDLLRRELLKTGVSEVIIMGREAEKARPIIESVGIDSIRVLKHPGWVVNHSENLKEMTFRKKRYLEDWTAAWNGALSDEKLSMDNRKWVDEMELTTTE